MRDQRIVIEPFEYIAILDLRIDSEVNQHTKAVMEIRISEEKVQEYMDRLMEETWVDVQSVDESDKRSILFQGVVTHFSMKTYHHETVLHLEMASGTFLMDVKEHFRTFQDRDMSCEAVHQILGNEYQDFAYLYLENKERVIDHFLIQYQETDWAFLKRLVAQANGILTAEGRRKGIRYYVGLPEGEKRQMEEGIKVHVDVNVGDFLEKKQNGISGINQADCVEVVFDSREVYEIGDIMPYGGRNYLIYKIESNYKGAECLHTYHLKSKNGLQILINSQQKSAGCAFDATVTEIERDKVKVNVMGDENGDRPERQWLTFSTVYSSPDGTGWYCMPEIGDSVQIYVPEKEGDTFVVNAVHKETDGGRSNPDYKSFKNRYGKEILLTPNRMLMTNNQGMRIELCDGQGILIESDKDIAIRAGGNLQVSSQTSSLLIAAEERVDVQQGNTTLTLKDDITFAGGEFRMQ